MTASPEVRYSENIRRSVSPKTILRSPSPRTQHGPFHFQTSGPYFIFGQADLRTNERTLILFRTSGLLGLADFFLFWD